MALSSCHQLAMPVKIKCGGGWHLHLAEGLLGLNAILHIMKLRIGVYLPEVLEQVGAGGQIQVGLPGSAPRADLAPTCEGRAKLVPFCFFRVLALPPIIHPGALHNKAVTGACQSSDKASRMSPLPAPGFLPNATHLHVLRTHQGAGADPPAAIFDSLSSGLTVGGQACADLGPTFALDQDLDSLVPQPRPCPSPRPPAEALLSLLCLQCEAGGPHRSGLCTGSWGSLSRPSSVLPPPRSL